MKTISAALVIKFMKVTLFAVISVLSGIVHLVQVSVLLN